MYNTSANTKNLLCCRSTHTVYDWWFVDVLYSVSLCSFVFSKSQYGNIRQQLLNWADWPFFSCKFNIIKRRDYSCSFARCLNTLCKTWLNVLKLYTQAYKTQHWEINHSTSTSKPNNPLSKCHTDDKMILTCIIWIHFKISSNTLVYFI